MCSLTLALTGLTTGLSMASQYQQSRAQAASYEAQAQAAQQQAEAARLQAKYQQQEAEAQYQNARIQNRKGEQIAEQYAEQQRQLDAKRRLTVSQQNVQAGASGIVGGLGSGLDIYNASMEAWNQDTLNLLGNQRNAIYDNYTQEVNLRNAGNAMVAQSANTNLQAKQYDQQAVNLKAQASAAKTMGNWAMIGTGLSFLGTTLAGGASSMSGAKAAAGTAQTPTAAGYVAQTADNINSGISGASGWLPQYSTGSIAGVTQNFGVKVLNNNTYSTGLSNNGVYFPMR